MNGQILITLILLAAFIGVIMFSELVYKKTEVKSEYTRKLAHVLGTLGSLILLFIYDSHWYVLFLGTALFLFLFFGKRYGKLKSIDSVERNTMGSYVLPIGIYLTFMLSDILDNKFYFVLPMLLLGISDPLAGLFGIKFSHKTRNIKIGGTVLEKTRLGSTVFFISSLIISSISFYVFGFSAEKFLIWGFIVAMVTTLTEMFSTRGLDNITVPLISVFLIWLSI